MSLNTNVKKVILFLCILILLLVFSLFVRQNSTGVEIRSTVISYLNCLSNGYVDSAHTCLTESLGNLILPEFLLDECMISVSERVAIIGSEDRGFAVAVRTGDGSRIVWLNRSDGVFRISGDTSLDGLLARGRLQCREYTLTTVVHALQNGEDLSDYRCPVSGSEYRIDTESGKLICIAGHLGDGISLVDERCFVRRDSLIDVITEYLAKGYPFPSTPAEMWSRSGGIFGQRGGYRCPDNGYSYYQIDTNGIYCPYHESHSSNSTILEGFEALSGAGVHCCYYIPGEGWFAVDDTARLEIFQIHEKALYRILPEEQ